MSILMTYSAEYILGIIKVYLNFLSFLDNEIAVVVYALTLTIIDKGYLLDAIWRH